MGVKLSAATLSNLPAKVAAPKYDRAALKAGIVHFGVGNFHRSHQAVYLDDLFNSGVGHDWAIVGAGVFDGEKVGRQKLEEQDWLTTVVEQDAGHKQARVTGVDDRFPDAGRLRPRSSSRLADPVDKDRLADHHRRRLFHRSGVGEIQPGASRHRRRRAEHGRAQNRLRPDPRGADAPARRGRRALHRHVLRQHSP